MTYLNLHDFPARAAVVLRGKISDRHAELANHVTRHLSAKISSCGVIVPDYGIHRLVSYF